jgi:Tfp pilus assembly protein PilV
MRIKNLNNTAFSLIEILMAAIIFVVTVAGVFATLSAVRAPIATKEQELATVLFEKQALEDLRFQVTSEGRGYFYFCQSFFATFYYGNPLNDFYYGCEGFNLDPGPHTVPLVLLPGDLQTSVNNLPPAVLTANSSAPCGTDNSGNPGPTEFCLQYTVSCADGDTSKLYVWPFTCSTADVARRVDITL